MFLGFPRITFDFDMRGLSRKIRIGYGYLTTPTELYDIINIAQDPDGVFYWKLVDEGTGPKEAGSSPYMYFMVDGRIIKKKFVAGNPAVNMRERAIPEIREYFKIRLREVRLQGPRPNPQDLTLQWLDQVFLDTALKAKELLVDLTPELQDQYVNEDPVHGTPEKGLLRDSYRVIDKRSSEEVG